MTMLARALAAAFLFLPGALPVAAESRIEIVPVTSPGGITAWLYEDHTLPIVTLEASFRGGAALEPPEEAGVTALMAGLLAEGADELDATGFAEAAESLAASLSFSAGQDGISVSATALRENLEPSLELLRLALVAPRFDPQNVAQARARQLATLRADATNPSRVASRAFWAAAFPGHPYAHPADGTPETVEGLDRDAVLRAYARAVSLDRLLVAVVGAISPEELAPLLDAVFGSLAAEGPPLPEPQPAALEGGVTVIDLPAPQAAVTFGHGGIARDDPDFIPAFVLDHILGGGGFGSRLTEEIRERRGLTYGIATWLAPNDFGWLYMGAFAASNERAAEAIELVRAEWQRVAAEGVTAEELDRAKRYLTGAYPLRFDGNARIAGQLLGLQIAGLGLDYVNERNALVEAVTLQDVARVARRLLAPERLTFVVAGRPEGLEPGE